MFQFPPFALTMSVTGLQPAGLPHSDITGSIPVCSSPVLFAAYHVLRRLQKPRHPPFALVTFSLYEFPLFLNHMPSATALVIFTRCLEIAVPNSTIRKDLYSLNNFCYRLFLYFFNFTSLSLSNLSMNFSASRLRTPYIAKRPLHCTRLAPCNPPQKLVSFTDSKKEVFQPHLPVRLPCYDLAPVTSFALGRSSRSRTSGAPGFHGLTGGVYKARERIHRAMADARLLANPTSWSRVADSNPNWDGFSRSASCRQVASLCTHHCNTCVAPDVRAVLI